MKTPKANRDEVREETITFTYEKPKKEKLQKLADDMGISMSAYIRLAINEKMNRKEA